MSISLTSAGRRAAGALGASAVAGAMLFGGTPIAQAAPAAPGTTFEMSGPHGAPGFPLRPRRRRRRRRRGSWRRLGRPRRRPRRLGRPQRLGRRAAAAAAGAVGVAILVGAMEVGGHLVWAIGPGGTTGGDVTPPGGTGWPRPWTDGASRPGADWPRPWTRRGQPASGTKSSRRSELRQVGVNFLVCGPTDRGAAPVAVRR